MTVRPTGPSAAQPPTGPQGTDLSQLATQLHDALGNVITHLENIRKTPHLVDSEKALEDLSKHIQGLHASAQKAQAVEA
ncbi:MAG: hypothetical protein K940chlam6_01156 [Chlamydiae bacterium]|nr:hypothetical protein [Chlamydiota bacterium]